MFEALRGAGLPDPLVVQAAEAVVSYTAGYALSDVVGAIGRPRDWATLSDLVSHKPDGWLCNLRIRGDADRPDFRTGLGFVLNGIEATAGGSS